MVTLCKGTHGTTSRGNRQHTLSCTDKVLDSWLGRSAPLSQLDSCKGMFDRTAYVSLGHTPCTCLLWLMSTPSLVWRVAEPPGVVQDTSRRSCHEARLPPSGTLAAAVSLSRWPREHSVAHGPGTEGFHMVPTPGTKAECSGRSPPSSSPDRVQVLGRVLKVHGHLLLQPGPPTVEHSERKEGVFSLPLPGSPATESGPLKDLLRAGHCWRAWAPRTQEAESLWS